MCKRETEREREEGKNTKNSRNPSQSSLPQAPAFSSFLDCFFFSSTSSSTSRTPTSPSNSTTVPPAISRRAAHLQLSPLLRHLLQLDLHSISTMSTQSLPLQQSRPDPQCRQAPTSNFLFFITLASATQLVIYSHHLSASSPLNADLARAQICPRTAISNRRLHHPSQHPYPRYLPHSTRSFPIVPTATSCITCSSLLFPRCPRMPEEKINGLIWIRDLNLIWVLFGLDLKSNHLRPHPKKEFGSDLFHI